MRFYLARMICLPVTVALVAPTAFAAPTDLVNVFEAAKNANPTLQAAESSKIAAQADLRNAQSGSTQPLD